MKKSDFQKSIEKQQERLEELYRKYSRENKVRKRIKIPEEYKELLVC